MAQRGVGKKEGQRETNRKRVRTKSKLCGEVTILLQISITVNRASEAFQEALE